VVSYQQTVRTLLYLHLRSAGNREIADPIVAHNTLCGAGNGPGASIDPVAGGKGYPPEICASSSLLRFFFEFSITCTETQRLSHNFSDLAEFQRSKFWRSRGSRGGRPAIRPGGTPEFHPINSCAAISIVPTARLTTSHIPPVNGRAILSGPSGTMSVALSPTPAAS
jgi:hypothetical protein